MNSIFKGKREANHAVLISFLICTPVAHKLRTPSLIVSLFLGALFVSLISMSPSLTSGFR
jgi:hypothetical protein